VVPADGQFAAPLPGYMENLRRYGSTTGTALPSSPSVGRPAPVGSRSGRADSTGPVEAGDGVNVGPGARERIDGQLQIN